MNKCFNHICLVFNILNAKKVLLRMFASLQEFSFMLVSEESFFFLFVLYHLFHKILCSTNLKSALNIGIGVWIKYCQDPGPEHGCLNNIYAVSFKSWRYTLQQPSSWQQPTFWTYLTEMYMWLKETFVSYVLGVSTPRLIITTKRGKCFINVKTMVSFFHTQRDLSNNYWCQKVVLSCTALFLLSFKVCCEWRSYSYFPSFCLLTCILYAFSYFCLLSGIM